MRHLVIIVCLLPELLFAQATKKVTKTEKYSGTEVYYVLKSDNSIKQGSYQKFDQHKTLMISGFYKNGAKDSIWEFYDQTGKLMQKFNYSTHELLFNGEVENKDMKYKVINGKDTIDAVLDKQPVYIGGSHALYKFISDSVNYPADARDDNVTGTIFISFSVDENGKMGDFTVVHVECKKENGQKMGSLKKEALRVAQMIPDEWVPGVLNGKPVKIQYILPIRFALN